MSEEKPLYQSKEIQLTWEELEKIKKDKAAIYITSEGAITVKLTLAQLKKVHMEERSFSRYLELEARVNTQTGKYVFVKIF